MREPLPFYSAYLAPLARHRHDGRRARVLRRTLILLVLAGLTLLLIRTVSGRWLPRNGAGWPLYWLHDAVFLPVKGYTYTLHFPVSLTWWLLTALIVGLCLLALLLDRSFLRAPHAWLSLRCVRLPGSEQWLYWPAMLLQRVGVAPTWLHGVVQHALALALLAAADSPAGRARPHLCAEIARLATFDLHLRALAPSPPLTAEHLAAAASWHAAFVPLDLRRRRNTAALHLEGASVTDPATRLAAQLPRWIGYPAPATADAFSGYDNPFGADRMLLDLWRVAHLAHSTLVLTVPKSLQPLDLSNGAPSVTVALLHSCHERTRVLQRWAFALQRAGRSALADALLLDELETDLEGCDRNALPAIGQLTVSLALHASWIGEAPHLATATLDAIELAALGVSLLNTERAVAVALAQLLGGLPAPSAYSLAGQLVALKVQGRWEEWTRFDAVAESPVQPLDHSQALAQVAALYQAAGPHMAVSAITATEQT